MAVIYQAEDALLSGVVTVLGGGAQGSYADYQNLTGDYIEWTIVADTAGSHDLSWRYANGTNTSNRPLRLDVNGATVVPSLGFANTSSWTTWSFVTQTVTLQAGVNKIRLTATGSSGANFDYLSVSPTPIAAAPNITISNATATEGTNSFLVFDMTLSGPSAEAITLGLGTTNGTATAGLDYNQALQFSSNGGSTWQTATNSRVQFTAGQTALKVRLAVIDDTIDEPSTPETMTFRVASVVSGTVGSTTDTGTGSIVDNDPVQGPDQIHLAWVSDPSTTLTTVWHTDSTSTPSIVEYRPAGTSTWLTATGALRPSGTTGTLHEVTLRSLTPDTAYEYRVQGDSSVWSDVFRTKTAPAPGPRNFTAIYFADTGLIGRTDGLTNGTAQAIREIDALNPTLLLGGGDYAYYNTDTRFPTLDRAIDEWFNQWEPVLSESPIMTTYGNHEVLLGEGFTPWANRFPTPTGFDSRRNYSFDVGDVHFVSILSVTEQTGLTNAQLNWIEQDIRAAQQRGQRWIIPYMHAGPFGDGANHPSNRAVRAQLGPLFERLNVDLVISSHDQAYERTYPLINVPTTNTKTSSSRTSYTRNDGVIYLKTSPTGKLSNKNGGFSPFSTATPPQYMAFRNNTMHHFTQLSFSATGSLKVDTYGFTGNGASPVIMDSFQITDGPTPLSALISNATATEGVNNFLVFDVTLSGASSQAITLNLAATDVSAKGGAPANFGLDVFGNPIDYANQQFQVSRDGINWVAASNGSHVTFAAGETSLKVRLAVNDDRAAESGPAETMRLQVANVVSGTVGNISDVGIGSIIDNDRIEAEAIANRSVYSLESITDASGGQALGLRSGATNEVGRTTFQFNGATGVYNVVIGTFDESDGSARFELAKNNTTVGSIILNQQLGSISANAQTKVARTIASSLSLQSGDTLTITGIENGAEHARFDYVDFVLR
jgi:acid phosphatase type 7